MALDGASVCVEESSLTIELLSPVSGCALRLRTADGAELARWVRACAMYDLVGIYESLVDMRLLFTMSS